MREKVFDDDMEEEIDVFDLECKEWGFSLRDLFGLGLGTGDYGHLTVEHASMLLRNFRSLRDYSNQGFEAAHKLQKQIFSRATNHDGSGEATSLDQILTHHYAEKLLYLRLCFRNAKECARQGKKFYFRGCGWNKSVSTKNWGAEHKRWIEVMDELFTTFLSKDFLTYDYSEQLSCLVTEGDLPTLEYDSMSWESILKHKMTEREWIENETPRTRKAKKTRLTKKTRRKLFKLTKVRKNRRRQSSVTISSISTSCKRKRKLGATTSPVSPKRKLRLFSSSNTTSHYDMSKPKIRRSLFTPCKRKCMEAPLQNLSSVKRKASSTPSSPLLLSPTLPSTPRSNTSHTVPSKPTGRKLPLSDTLEFSATTSPPSVASGQIPSASTLPSDSSDFLASTLSATILPPSDMRRLASSPPLAANTMQGTKPRQFPLSIPSDPENVMLHSSSLPSFSRVFSSTCPREIILTNPLPPVDRSITAQQNTLMRVPGDFVFTDVTELKTRPPASVVHAAVNLIRQEKKFSDESGKPIDLDIEDEATGIAIGQLGIFSRTGLGHLEWLGEIAEMQLSVKEEEKWLMQSPDDLDNETREKCLHVLKKCPLNYLVASEGKCSVTVRAFSNLCLERYIDDSVIDTTIARLHRQSTCKEGVLCLPAHTMTWLDTGDKKFIHECFKERLVEVNPEKLSLVLVPVNLSGTHWGLLVIDVRLKEVYFDDGLRWTFSNMSCVLQIVRELHFVFPGCDHFSLRHWLMLKTFKRFGMPRQPGGGQVIGSGSCGVGVILSVKDFIMSGLPFRPSWTFNEMTVHRKNIMKLLLSSQ